MNNKKLYTVDGKECFFKYTIDYQQALDTGLYFEENPMEKAAKEIEEERASKRSRRLEKQEQVQEEQQEEIS